MGGAHNAIPIIGVAAVGIAAADAISPELMELRMFLRATELGWTRGEHSEHPADSQNTRYTPSNTFN